MEHWEKNKARFYYQLRRTKRLAQGLVAKNKFLFDENDSLAKAVRYCASEIIKMRDEIVSLKEKAEVVNESFCDIEEKYLEEIDSLNKKATTMFDLGKKIATEEVNEFFADIEEKYLEEIYELNEKATTMYNLGIKTATEDVNDFFADVEDKYLEQISSLEEKIKNANSESSNQKETIKKLKEELRYYIESSNQNETIKKLKEELRYYIHLIDEKECELEIFYEEQKRNKIEGKKVRRRIENLENRVGKTVNKGIELGEKIVSLDLPNLI